MGADQFIVKGTVLDLINKNIVQYRDSIAVVIESKHLTYSELNKDSNKVANFLRSNGLHTDELVGIYVNHSIESIIGILGILKSGCGYMPINPEHPKARINYMLTESAVKLALDMSQLEIDELSSEYDQLEISNNSLAYVIYTSGSTGIPKGVMLTHKGLINCIKETITAFGLRRNDRILQFASMSFDVSVWEIFTAFCLGASLVLCSDRKNLLNFQNYPATVVVTTPSVLKINDYVPSIINTLISGAETLDKSAIDKFARVSYRFNAYGPTENSIISTVLYFDSSEANENSIGKAINNTQIYALNHSFEQLPIGIAGKICIGGVGLARGYLNRPDLTAEKFIANPFGNGDRLYRTGDLGSYLPDGNLQFLGRMDNQVKIRGFRIELREIESAINDCDQVKISVVLAKDGQLVAYIVLSDTKNLEESYKFETQQSEEITVFAGESAASLVESVRAKISQKLPEYMVPSYFVVLEKIPLTPNGKTDSKLLQTLDTGRRLITDEYVAPRNEIEQKLCEIWQDILHVDKVGINDNFFKIGGDSILAIYVTMKAKKNGLDFSIKDVFLKQCIKYLATTAKSFSNCETYHYEVSPFELCDRKNLENYINSDLLQDAYPLSPMQKGLLFSSLISNDAVYLIQNVIKIDSSIDVNALKKAWVTMVNAYDVLRSGVIYEMADPIQYVLKKVETVPFFEYDGKNIDEEVFIEEDRNFGIDLTQAPLIRISLIKYTDKKYSMILTYSHIILDGWSSGYLINQLLRAYSDIIKGEKPTFAKCRRFVDYIALFNNERFEKMEEFWMNYLANLEGTSQFPEIIMNTAKRRLYYQKN